MPCAFHSRPHLSKSLCNQRFFVGEHGSIAQRVFFPLSLQLVKQWPTHHNRSACWTREANNQWQNAEGLSYASYTNDLFFLSFLLSSSRTHLRICWAGDFLMSSELLQPSWNGAALLITHRMRSSSSLYDKKQQQIIIIPMMTPFASSTMAKNDNPA